MSLSHCPRPILALVASLLLFLPGSLAAAPQQVILGTGVESGVYYPVGGTICRFVNRKLKDHGIRCLIESTSGSVANINALRDGEIQAGLMQSDLQYSAYHGDNPFAEGGQLQDLRSIFSLYNESFTVVARDDSGIKNFEQLKGKRVNIGNPGSGMRATMDDLMRARGWTNGIFRTATEYRASEQTSRLCNGSDDAFVYATGHPNGAIQMVLSTCPSHLVAVGRESVGALLEKYPYYSPAIIPGGMYQSNPEDVPTFGVTATLVTTRHVPDAVVYAMVKEVFDNFEEFKTTHPILATLEKKEMIRNGLTAPLHEGAKRYYREVGLLQ